MRAGPVLITCALLASACASSQSVEVSSSDQLRTVSPPAVDAADSSIVDITPTTTTTIATTAVAEANIETIEPDTDIDIDSGVVRAGSSPYVLIETDLPDWDLLGPFEVPDEPVWLTADCDDMNTAWATTGRAGVRTRGSNDGTAFRNTAVEFESTTEALGVIEAIERVAVDCVQFSSEGPSFWAEPIEMPDSLHPSAGIVIGSSDISAWVLAYWQVNNTIVSLEANGDDVWSDIDELLAALDSRLALAELPVLTDPDEAVPTTTNPVDPVTPPTDEPVADPATNPDEAWRADPLARLIPTADDVGGEWEYSYGSIVEAVPADENEIIPGCDVEPPPTLAGIDASFSSGFDSLEISVAEGDPSAAQEMIDALRGITQCTLDEEEHGVGGYDLIDRTVADADDAVFITASITGGFGDDSAFHLSLGIARYDGLLLGVYIGAEGSANSDQDIELIANLIEQMESSR